MEPTDSSGVIDNGPSEIERLNEEVRREHGMYLRALADFDNYRRRMERERGTASLAGKRDVLLSVLEVLDSFDSARAHMEQMPSSVAAGIEAIYRQLLAAVERHGVTPFDSVGQEFDPAVHEAVGSVAANGRQPGTVVEEMQRGYKLGDQLLRPARVRVAQ